MIKYVQLVSASSFVLDAIVWCTCRPTIYRVLATRFLRTLSIPLRGMKSTDVLTWASPRVLTRLLR